MINDAVTPCRIQAYVGQASQPLLERAMCHSKILTLQPRRPAMHTPYFASPRALLSHRAPRECTCPPVRPRPVTTHSPPPPAAGRRRKNGGGGDAGGGLRRLRGGPQRRRYRPHLRPRGPGPPQRSAPRRAIARLARPPPRPRAGHARGASRARITPACPFPASGAAIRCQRGGTLRAGATRPGGAGRAVRQSGGGGA
jgi:hypothetical protein